MCLNPVTLKCIIWTLWFLTCIYTIDLNEKLTIDMDKRGHELIRLFKIERDDINT